MIINCPTKQSLLALTLGLASVLLPSKIFAAAPDGAGPWADSVVSSAQGLRKDGSAVLAARSDATSALGVAEDDTVDAHFFSLGFGGSLTLKFDNPQSGGVVVVEATNLGYPQEKASVEVSENGTTWVSAGSVTQDGEVSVPSDVCVQYVRVKDTSNSADFSDDSADAYDVDGIKLTGNTCTPKHNGGDTTVIIKQETNCEVEQKSTTNVVNVQSSNASTGGNKIKKTTGTTNTVTTGNAKSKNKVKVTGGSNVAVNPCGGCCGGGNISVTVGKNGSASTLGAQNCTQ